jgi:hypothetical protein
MVRPPGPPCLLIAVVLAGLACTSPLGVGQGMNEGGAGSGGSPGGTGGAGAGGSGATPDAGTPDAEPPGTFVPDTTPLPDRDTIPGPVPLRRLSLLEYTNTIRDLLGIADAGSNARGRFAVDINAGDSGFNQGAAIITDVDARAFLESGEEIGAAVAQKLAMLVPCTPIPTAAAEQEACASKFITTFGLRAYRRPLVPKESEKLLALYRTLRGADAADTFEQAIGDLVAAMVNAPEFLYHRQQGPNPPIKEGRLVRFGPYELASRLSYLFWASMPDQALLDAARDGRLSGTEGIVQQARRLYADSRAREAVEDFHWQWLEGGGLEDITKDAALVNFTPEVARSMIGESRAFAAGLFFGPDADGRLEALLIGTSSFIDAGLAKVYGLPAPMGMGLQPVSLNAKERAGIFTRGAFLARKSDADGSNPVMRGDAILHRLLCMDIPVPDNILIPPVPDPRPSVTTRERFESLDKQPCAQPCHAFIDPLGFALENYDAIGAYRTTDNGKAVDASGSIVLTGGDLVFKDAIDLMPQLAKTLEARDCMATQWLRYLLRRREILSEQPTQRALARVFREKGLDMRHLLFGLVRSLPFTHRVLMNGEAP